MLGALEQLVEQGGGNEGGSGGGGGASTAASWRRFALRRKRRPICNVLGRNSNNGVKGEDITARWRAIETKWRPHTCRIFPFSKLQTPAEDAVIAMDWTGSYLVATGGGYGRRTRRRSFARTTTDDGDGGGDDDGSVPFLSVRF